MMVKITGQILKAFPAQSGVSQSSGNQWMSQDFVLQHDFDPQHPKYLSFRVFGQQRIQQLNLQEGQMVILSLDFNAREYNGRWYNEISAFKVEYPGVQQQMPPQQQMQGGMQMPPMQGGMPPQQQMPPMQAPQQQMPPQGAMPPQQQGCQTYYQNGANQMGYNVPPQQGGMPPQQAMPQQAPFPPQS